jgi:Zn-dependent M28 family amino/carboxypeptidase
MLLLPFWGKAQSKEADRNYMKYCLKTLAADSMGGREAGSEYDMMAADFIATEFKNSRIKAYQDSSYFRNFTYQRDSTSVKTRNIIAGIDNHARQTVIIGAHYDHIGFGGKRSRSYGKIEVHNGADDNASGIALMLALAKQIKELQLKKFNFIFVAFSGHEDGLYGSEHFVKSKKVADSSIKLMINLDMVGRADTQNPELFVAGNDSCLTTEFKASAATQDLITFRNKELPPGDHTAFASHHISVLFLTTGMEDDYHKVTDDESLINFKAMIAIEKVIMEFLVKMK